MNVRKNFTKRIFVLLAAVTAGLFLGGCRAASEAGMPDPARIAAAEIEENGRIWHVIPEEGGFTAGITSPAVLGGTRIVLREAEAYISAGGVRIPVEGRFREAAEELIAALCCGGYAVTDVRDDPTAACRVISYENGASVRVSGSGPMQILYKGNTYPVRSLTVRESVHT